MRSIAMLFVGRVLWGIGVGFGDHCAFIYTSEMAPPKWRGRLNTLVQCGTITGIVVASAINIGTSRVLWGWRISLGLAAVPGTILLLGEHACTATHDEDYTLTVDAQHYPSPRSPCMHCSP